MDHGAFPCDSVSVCFLTGSAELVAIYIAVSVVIVAGVFIAVVIVVILIMVTIISQRNKPGSSALVTNDNHELLFVQTDIKKSDVITKLT